MVISVSQSGTREGLKSLVEDPDEVQECELVYSQVVEADL